jgi:hypothetical protein
MGSGFEILLAPAGVRDATMKNVVRVNPRSKLPIPERCPRCGKPDIELRPDGAYLCGKCFYTTKPRVNPSLLQSWSGTIFSLGGSGEPPEELALGGRVAAAGGLLSLVAVALAVGPFPLEGSLGRLLAPTPPSELALFGGATVVGILGLVALFSGYTMSRGDPKAWRAALPAGLLGLILGILGPGGVLGILAGGLALLGGYIGRAD